MVNYGTHHQCIIEGNTRCGLHRAIEDDTNLHCSAGVFAYRVNQQIKYFMWWFVKISHGTFSTFQAQNTLSSLLQTLETDSSNLECIQVRRIFRQYETQIHLGGGIFSFWQGYHESTIFGTSLVYIEMLNYRPLFRSESSFQQGTIFHLPKFSKYFITGSARNIVSCNLRRK